MRAGLPGSVDARVVMEQHPTLPLVTVSGIDNTVKVATLFAEDMDL